MRAVCMLLLLLVCATAAGQDRSDPFAGRLTGQLDQIDSYYRAKRLNRWDAIRTGQDVLPYSQLGFLQWQNAQFVGYQMWLRRNFTQSHAKRHR